MQKHVLDMINSQFLDNGYVHAQDMDMPWCTNKSCVLCNIDMG